MMLELIIRLIPKFLRVYMIQLPFRCWIIVPASCKLLNLRRWSWCYSYFVWLCCFYYGAFDDESCVALCSRVFSSVLFIAPRLGNRKLVYALLMHLFVRFACVDFCPSSLPLGVRIWLRLVILALPGCFY